MVKPDMDAIRKLSVSERLALVEEIWDSISEEPASVPVSEAQLAEAVCARFPSIELVRFCNSGTEGNLFALSTARAVTGRSHIMVFEGGYHGGMLYYAKGGSPINAPFPTVIGHYNDAEFSLDLIEQHAGELAAILIEPMMGAGGCIAAEPEFLRALLRATDVDLGLIVNFHRPRLKDGGLVRVLNPDKINELRSHHDHDDDDVECQDANKAEE